ncbi:hypothetical protein LMH73_019650 [Vibrio splendidus]|nr:hypothetical protein [Vibrio splendidus]MCC4882465.1 hypothetical protein [Vibrio splendidus]
MMNDTISSTNNEPDANKGDSGQGKSSRYYALLIGLLFIFLIAARYYQFTQCGSIKVDGIPSTLPSSSISYFQQIAECASSMQSNKQQS